MEIEIEVFCDTSEHLYRQIEALLKLLPPKAQVKVVEKRKPIMPERIDSDFSAKELMRKEIMKLKNGYERRFYRTRYIYTEDLEEQEFIQLLEKAGFTVVRKFLGS